MFRMECLNLVQHARIEGLALTPDARDAHELDICYVVCQRFDECEIGFDIERETDRYQIGRYPSTSEVSVRPREKSYRIGGALDMEGEARCTERDPRLGRALGVQAHEINLVRDLIECRQQVTARNPDRELVWCGKWPRGWTREVAIDNIDLYASHERHVGEHSNLAFELLPRRGQNCRNDEMSHVDQLELPEPSHMPLGARERRIDELLERHARRVERDEARAERENVCVIVLTHRGYHGE